MAADPFATQDQDQTAADQAAAANQDTAWKTPTTCSRPRRIAKMGSGKPRPRPATRSPSPRPTPPTRWPWPAARRRRGRLDRRGGSGRLSWSPARGLQPGLYPDHGRRRLHADRGGGGRRARAPRPARRAGRPGRGRCSTEQTAQTLGDAAAQDQLASAQQAALDGYNNGVAQAYVAYLSFRRFQAGQVARCR